MEEKVFICKNRACGYPCIQNHALAPPTCPRVARFIETSEYKITKTPDPVWILDIPEKYRRWINPELMKRQGESGNTWDDALHDLGWLKQIPAEPTVEEDLQKKIRIINKIADVVYKDMAFTQLLPEQIKRILAGEE